MTDPEQTYEIQEVAELTGLSTARLRAWERRYDVVRPERQANGYRAYTASQVALLRAFARLVNAGERIGDLAADSRDAVIARAEAAAGDARRSPPSSTPSVATIGTSSRPWCPNALALASASADSPRKWCSPSPPRSAISGALGKLPIASEHLASEVVVHALKGAIREAPGEGPLLLAAGLPGERHEWGLLSTLAAAQSEGWQVHYLGADLPLDEVIQAAWTLRPAAVALSASDPELVQRNLPALNRFVPRLPPGVRAVIGGRGAFPAGNILLHHGFHLELGRPAPAVRR